VGAGFPAKGLIVILPSFFYRLNDIQIIPESVIPDIAELVVGGIR
jgi:hypothetical protein